MTRPFRLAWVLTAAAWLAGGMQAVFAQDVAAVLGQRVQSVRLMVEGREDTSPALLSLSDVHVGEPLRQDEVRSTIAHFDGLGRYENIITTATPVTGGVDVVFTLVPRHPVDSLEIRGNSGISSGSLRTLLLQRYGGVPTTQRIESVAATAAELLQDEGYLQARVTASTEASHDPDKAALVLTADAGTLARIAHTEVQGASPLSSDDVIRRTETTPGAPYKRRDIQAAATALEADLRTRGFYEAQVTVPPPPAGAQVDLVVNMYAGPRVELRVEPADALSRGDIDALIPIKRLGAADQDLLEDSRARVERSLKAEGYWHAAAPFTRELSADGKTLTIVFTVTRGPRFFVDHVDWPPTLALPIATVRDSLGVRDGDLFDEQSVRAGLDRVKDDYHRDGYYKVQTNPTYETVDTTDAPTRELVVIHPNITEGPQGRIAAVTFKFATPPKVAEADLRQSMRQHAGGTFVDADVAQDREALRTLYRNRGFRSVAVDITPSFSADGKDVSLTVAVNEGPQILIGQVTVVGNQRITEATILREMGLSPGQPAGDAALNDAQRRLIDMGSFRRVTLTLSDQIAGDDRARVLVNVVESSTLSVTYSGGLEGGRQLRTGADGELEDYLSLSPRGSFEIERRNLGGRNRSLDFFSRVSLKPRSAPGDPLRDGRGFGFTEYRVAGTYQERHAFGSDVDLLIGSSFEQGARTNFNYLRKSVNAEALRRLTSRVNVSGRYALEFTRVFDDRIAADDPLQPLIDRLFPQVRLSYFSGGISWDRRPATSRLTPTSGTFVTADVDVAARAIGSQVGYTKIFLQGSAFHAIDEAKKTVLAGRAELGLARGFPRTVTQVDANGNPVLDADGNPVIDLVEDLPASQRFYAGGGTTVRGFQLDRLGVPEILTSDGLSLGGNAVVILNGELRRIVRQILGHSLSAVGFVDAGNVFATAGTLDLTRLRAATGFGVRYDSPLGPIRLDFGFKTHRDIVGGELEREWEYHLSIGEAF